MMPHEQQLLEQFLQRVNAAQGIAQDPQAQAMIQQRLAQQPDASYLLVQRALLLEQALESAQQRIQQLEQQAQDRTAAGSSFLGQGLDTHLDTRFGRNPEPAAPAASAYSSAPMAAQPGSWRQRWFGAAPQTSAPMAAPAAPMGAGPAGGSWLGSAASTAAGVAGGMFLFNGLENLLSGQHSALGGASHGLAGQSWQNPLPDTANNGSTLAQDAGAGHVQDSDNWASNSSDGNDDSSFLDDDGSSWDA